MAAGCARPYPGTGSWSTQDKLRTALYMSNFITGISAQLGTRKDDLQLKQKDNLQLKQGTPQQDATRQDEIRDAQDEIRIAQDEIAQDQIRDAQDMIRDAQDEVRDAQDETIAENPDAERGEAVIGAENPDAKCGVAAPSGLSDLAAKRAPPNAGPYDQKPFPRSPQAVATSLIRPEPPDFTGPPVAPPYIDVAPTNPEPPCAEPPTEKPPPEPPPAEKQPMCTGRAMADP